MRAAFHFDPQLSVFLDRAKRDGTFAYDCARAATLKNAIEALGVPHTEVGALRVNGEPATLQRIVREGDYVEVETPKSGSDPDLHFVADAHLGGLARFLRMLGFDTLHRNAFSDEEIRRLAQTEGRIALKPEAELREVARRYSLEAHARPFSLCLACNLPLQPAERSAVAARVPPAVLDLHEHFVRCPGCNGVFWPGSHYRRMLSALRSSFDVPS
jgi:uncharacterized protein with PIN domain/sulfur carrier protein ThiS